MASAILPRRRLVASLYSCIETSPPSLYQRIAAHHWPQIQFRLRSTSTSLPKYAQPSIWQSIIPRSIRERGLFRRDKKSDGSAASPASKEWNPASFFIIIFTLIGSQAIQLLVLRKDTENYKRRTDAKLELLREVIQRLQNGEQVDVEKLLGTGDEAKEREWEEGEMLLILCRFVSRPLC